MGSNFLNQFKDGISSGSATWAENNVSWSTWELRLSRRARSLKPCTSSSARTIRPPFNLTVDTLASQRVVAMWPRMKRPTIKMTLMMVVIGPPRMATTRLTRPMACMMIGFRRIRTLTRRPSTTSMMMMLAPPLMVQRFPGWRSTIRSTRHILMPGRDSQTYVSREVSFLLLLLVILQLETFHLECCRLQEAPPPREEKEKQRREKEKVVRFHLPTSSSTSSLQSLQTHVVEPRLWHVWDVGSLVTLLLSAQSNRPRALQVVATSVQLLDLRNLWFVWKMPTWPSWINMVTNVMMWRCLILVPQLSFVDTAPFVATSTTWRLATFRSRPSSSTGAAGSFVLVVMVKAGVTGWFAFQCVLVDFVAELKCFSSREKPLCYVEGPSLKLWASSWTLPTRRFDSKMVHGLRLPWDTMVSISCLFGIWWMMTIPTTTLTCFTSTSCLLVMVRLIPKLWLWNSSMVRNTSSPLPMLIHLLQDLLMTADHFLDINFRLLTSSCRRPTLNTTAMWPTISTTRRWSGKFIVAVLAPLKWLIAWVPTLRSLAMRLVGTSTWKPTETSFFDVSSKRSLMNFS